MELTYRRDSFFTILKKKPTKKVVAYIGYDFFINSWLSAHSHFLHPNTTYKEDTDEGEG